VDQERQEPLPPPDGKLGLGPPPGPAAPPPPRRGISLQGLRVGARWAGVGAVLGLLVAGGAVWAWVSFGRGLPSLPSIAEYRPPAITEVVSADGQIAGEFFVERRKVVPYDRIPRQVIQAA